MWERYCSGVSAIVFAVDSTIPLPPESNNKKNVRDQDGACGLTSDAWTIAAEELHSLIQRPALAGLPLLVLATKNDLPNHASIQDVVSVLCVFNSCSHKKFDIIKGSRGLLLQHQQS